jgi:aquaporin Z
MRNALIAEFIGTFFLYLIIGMCVTPPGAAALTPLAIGIGLAALVYSCGHLSKAHFNPATTVTYFCAGTHSGKAFLPFVAVIFAGAVAASLCVAILNPEGLAEVVAIDPTLPRVIVAEFLFTFALMWVILNVAISTGTPGNQFYGIAIGGIVAAGAYAVGPISFAAFNPAVTLALAINGFLPWFAVPVYWLTQALAAAIAGLIFKTLGTTHEAEFSGKPWN